jgi:hypothetical protein
VKEVRGKKDVCPAAGREFKHSGTIRQSKNTKYLDMNHVSIERSAEPSMRARPKAEEMKRRMTVNTKFHTQWLGLAAVLFLLLAMLAPGSPAHADSCLVTTGADSGEGSLRAMIGNPVCETITFDGDYTVVLASHLAIERNVTIDGAGHSVTVSGNHAVRVFVVNAGATLHINHLNVVDGYASSWIPGDFFDYDGGGIHNQGTLDVSNSVFSGNGANGHGGAIFNAAGTLTLFNTTIHANSGMFGSAIFNYAGTLNMTNSTMSDNHAGGGCVLNIEGTATLTNCTFKGNRQGAFGNSYDTATLTNCTFSDNPEGGVITDHGATTTMVNTIVVNNGEYGNCSTRDASTLIASSSLADDESCGPDFYSSSILLGPLADNGGPTLTMALLDGSAAIDAGDDAVCPATDQRGVARPQGAHCDVGAYEAEITAGNTAPIASPGGPYLGAINTDIVFDGTGSSDADGDPLTYAWTFGDGGTAADAMPAHSYAVAEIYDVCLTVNDGTVDSPQVCTLAVVYDPTGGFVTGGGWINSPAGAYKADPGMAGQATFGFVSKYKKGATVPTGNTAFQFDAAGFSFTSDTYEWLVVNQGGTNAQFKGSGTINGALDPNGVPYKFMIWATDGPPDKLRIRIWWETDGVETVEHDVYDNGAEQDIGAGNIVVHTGK